MTKCRLMSSGGGARRFLGVVASVVGLAVCSPALAKSPAGDFAGFSQCPRFTTGVNLCFLAHVTSGEVGIGRTVVPIHRTIVLQGGIIHETSQPFAETFVAAINGETLPPAPLAVPGGLQGVLAPELLPKQVKQAFQEAVAKGRTVVMATTELAGNPTINRVSLIDEEGIGLSLPVRIRLDNQFLGRECYLGSRTSPVVLNLTTGKTSPPLPNKPTMGEIGGLSFRDEAQLALTSGTSLVDNAFPVPRVTGCGGSLSSLVDPAIDAKLGLPSKAGNNTAVLGGWLEEATTVGVIASER